MRPYALRSAGVWVVLLLVLYVFGCARSTPMPQDRNTEPTGAMAGTGEGQTGVNSGRFEERERQLPEGGLRPGEPSPMGTGASMSRDDFMEQDIHFAFNSFTLSGDAKDLLAQKAQWLSSNPEIEAQIEGHCDERGTIAYNLALGERRANAVRQYLMAMGISPSRLTSISYGEEFPLDPGHDEEAWARNRRAHFAILNQ